MTQNQWQQYEEMLRLEMENAYKQALIDSIKKGIQLAKLKKQNESKNK